MSVARIIESGIIGNEARIAIVLSKYNTQIVDRLVDGCLSTLRAAGIKDESITLVKVPGAFEIPVVVHKLAEKGKYQAIITLGAIIRGETPHFEFIADSCSQGISRIAAEFSLPIAFGVLTVDTIQQAMDRSGDEESNKGSEAAKTALEMISVMSKLVDE
jgi:6,7-dimethyl-8-ribityllumazine synthase